MGTLGKPVPSGYPCVVEATWDDALDASGIGEVDQAAAETIAQGLTR